MIPSFEISATGLSDLRANRMSGETEDAAIAAEYIAVGTWL